MTADDLPPNGADVPDAPDVDPPIAGSLRVLLASHVDDDIATDATWAGIERAAAARRVHRTRRRTIVVAALAAAALVAVFLVVRVEAARDEDTRVTTEPDVVQDPTEGTDPDSWVRLLAHVPSIETSDQDIAIFDLERARRDAGVDALAAAPSEDEWTQHSMATFGHPNVLSYAVGPAPSPDELRAELGIGHEQFDRVATFRPVPGLNRYVATGRFDPDAIAAAVAADPQWSPMLEVRQYRGITYYRWGDDLRLYRKSPARDLGNGGRLVVGDGWVSWTYTDAEAEATIDAWLDPTTSLATVEPFRLAVDDGDQSGLTQLWVALASLRESSGTTVFDPLPDLPPLDRPLTWWRGSAGTATDVEQYGLGYASDEQAADNLDAYEESWHRFATDAAITVRQVGSSVVATVELPEVDAGTAPGLVSDGTTRRSAGSFLLYFDVHP